MDTALRPRPHWWQWPTVLSLDAPLIVLVWQAAMARVAGVELRWPHIVVLGASVWLAYVADRWFEGWHLAPSRVRTQRHRFYQRRRWSVAVVWVLVFAADVSVAVMHLHRKEIVAGVLLLAPALLYVLSHQLVHRHRRWRAPKEICIALLLAGGVAVFIVPQAATAIIATRVPLVLFAGLCFANLALIARWELEVDKTHGQTSLARQSRTAAIMSRGLPWALAAVSFAIAITRRGPADVVLACAGTSGLLLGIIDVFEPQLGWQLARVLADAALLTPVIAPAVALFR